MVLVLKVVIFEVRGPLRRSIHQFSERIFTKFRVSTHQISDQTSTKFSNKESTRKKSAYNQEYCNFAITNKNRDPACNPLAQWWPVQTRKPGQLASASTQDHNPNTSDPAINQSYRTCCHLLRARSKAVLFWTCPELEPLRELAFFFKVLHTDCH